MLRKIQAVALVTALAAGAGIANAKDKVKVGFIGPLTGGVSVNGIGGRNSADLAVRLRNADPKAKYEYELVVLDDECKPNVAVQQATKWRPTRRSSPARRIIVQRPRLRRSTPTTSSASR
jgi:branched-chain amino acid transport system substrate-binding protein